MNLPTSSCRCSRKLWAAVLVWPLSAHATFRTCDGEVNEAYAAHTQYVIGEIDFDHNAGEASGTETSYNYSNRAYEGFSHCHVTYELQGSYEPVSGTFVMDAIRTNYSAICPGDFIAAHYTHNQSYYLQLQFEDDGTARVSQATSGEFLANADWRTGRAVYRTKEKCTAF